MISLIIEICYFAKDYRAELCDSLTKMNRPKRPQAQHFTS